MENKITKWKSATIFFIMVIIILGTMAVVKYPSFFVKNKSETVEASVLVSGYSPGVFSSCYSIGKAKCDYDKAGLIPNAEKGVLIIGPQITLPAGKYSLRFKYNLITQEFYPDKTYVTIDISSETGTLLKSPQKVTGKDLAFGNSNIEFEISEEKKFVSWNINYSDNIKFVLNKMELKKEK